MRDKDRIRDTSTSAVRNAREQGATIRRSGVGCRETPRERYDTLVTLVTPHTSVFTDTVQACARQWTGRIPQVVYRRRPSVGGPVVFVDGLHDDVGLLLRRGRRHGMRGRGVHFLRWLWDAGGNGLSGGR